MNIKSFSYTNTGGCAKNDDYVCSRETDASGVFVLCDGLGGHKGGDIAAKIAASSLLANSDDEIMSAERLSELFAAANAEVAANQLESGLARMRTTAVLLQISGGAVMWAHVGDSRLYCISNGRIVYISTDHSVSYIKYASGEISFAEINTDDDRSSLLKVIGGGRSEPEVLNVPHAINSGDAFLLASDGLWEYLYSEEILIDRLKSESPRQWAEYMLLRHIRRTRPGNDNYSLITVMVE
ncbi:MAG: serine/threonine-protein phosphatase [Oscillospiraceae bacterium]|jgi:serine/threonine protein phosphatase PrpC|nr:serine/threonine-protein phosphatase [Oscillospiraceae bacterium]